jgi:hypothetical protein
MFRPLGSRLGYNRYMYSNEIAVNCLSYICKFRFWTQAQNQELVCTFIELQNHKIYDTYIRSRLSSFWHLVHKPKLLDDALSTAGLSVECHREMIMTSR